MSHTRGPGRAQTGRSCRMQGRGACGDMVIQGRGSGIPQNGGGRGVSVMIFKGVLRLSL